MSKLFNFDRLVSKVEAYVEAKVKLATMNVKEELANTLTKLFPLMVLGFASFIIVIFLSITLGLLLNHLLNSTWLGFALLTGVYLLFFLVLLQVKDTARFRKFFKKKILNAMNRPND